MSDAYLGIDLAAQPAGTAACRLAFGDGGAVVEELRAGLDDDDLDTLRAGVRLVAIDSPFGWPRAFTAAVGAWAGAAEWPARDARELRFRATDLDVQRQTGLWPLSVSTDRIGVCAFRCAGLLARWRVADRSGGGGVAEVYPAAALRCWELPARGYKASAASAPDVRERLVAELRARCPWLALDDEQAAACAAVHDVLDALLCALVARAVDLGATRPAPPELAALAREEGWIHLPTGGLAALQPPAAT